jgi:NhaP-type Na+/H+ or K+/H+ antiporter
MMKKHLSIFVAVLCCLFTISLSGQSAPTFAQGAPTATAQAAEGRDCLNNTNHPQARRLAARFDVSYDEIMAWHCSGRGFGEIRKAYALAQRTRGTDNAVTVEQVFAMRDARQGWGQILRQYGLKMKDLK